MSALSQSMLVAVPLAPLVGAVVAGLFGKTVGRRGAHAITILGVAIAFVLSAMTLKAVAVAEGLPVFPPLQAAGKALLAKLR